MPEVICNTSPLQYLHQISQLRLLPALARRVVVPTAVAEEIATGRARGVNLPDLSALDWVEVRRPSSAPVLPLVTDLGPGETAVLALAIESSDAIVVLDDAVARRVAESLHLKLTGTLGVLLSARRAGLIAAVAPMLDKLDALRFRISPHTRAAVLRLAGESG